MIEYPDYDDALDICQRLGLVIRDAGALASSLDRPAQMVWGSEAYVGLDLKAAALLDSISRNHPLHDGNKRLAYLLVALFYVLNGRRLVVDPDEGDVFMRTVAGDEHLELDEIAAWLNAHTSDSASS